MLAVRGSSPEIPGGTATIALTSGPTFSALGQFASINDFGLVAFQGTLDAGGSGIFASNGGAPVTIASTGGGVYSSFVDAVAINNAGKVAYSANLVAGGSGLYARADGGALATIGETSGIFSIFLGFDINSSGRVAFFAGLDEPTTGIFQSDGTTLTTIARPAPWFQAFNSFGQGASINDRGTVGFSADIPGDAGIFTGNGGLASTVVLRNSTAYGTFLGAPAINASGGAAFTALLDGGTIFGLYAGADPVADKVVQSGDALFGSTLTGLGFSVQGLNDAGQIAFKYQLADGRTGIAVATQVPEPGIAGLLALGAVGLLGRRR